MAPHGTWRRRYDGKYVLSQHWPVSILPRQFLLKVAIRATHRASVLPHQVIPTTEAYCLCLNRFSPSSHYSPQITMTSLVTIFVWIISTVRCAVPDLSAHRVILIMATSHGPHTTHYVSTPLCRLSSDETALLIISAPLLSKSPLVDGMIFLDRSIQNELQLEQPLRSIPRGLVNC